MVSSGVLLVPMLLSAGVRSVRWQRLPPVVGSRCDTAWSAKREAIGKSESVHKEEEKPHRTICRDHSKNGR